MAKLAPLCSSSKGNSVFIGDSKSGILIDAGASLKALKTGLSLNGIPFDAVKLILITHEHTDHVKALFQITKTTDIPIYASDGTIAQLVEKELIFSDRNIHSLGQLSSAPTDIEIKYFHTPHDSAESVGYTFSWGERKAAICTDLGHVTDETARSVSGCDTVYLEANYEPDMLKRNPNYPPYLKARIASDNGHLSNQRSAEFCAELVKSGTRRLMLAHLSQENNTPATAFNAVEEKLSANGLKRGSDYTLDVAPVTANGNYITF